MTSSSAPVYVGTYRHNLDGKNRLTIPSKWRFAGDEADVYLLVPHPEGYLMVLPPEEKNRMLELVRSVKYSDAAGQAFIQRAFSLADAVGCDKQGRVALSKELAEVAGISREAVLVGNMIRFSIWNPEKWDKQAGQTKGEVFGDLMRQLNF